MDPFEIDDGTLARTGSPPPGPIGLDARRGAPARSGAGMADRIVAYARQRRGDRVGNGECYTLTDRALRNAGAKSADDYGTVTPDADYVWGASVNLAELRPGDVIQFRDYHAEIEVVTEEADRTTTTTEEQERPHHTAIVERVNGGGSVTVLEQNSPDGAPVVRTELFFASGESASGNRTTRVRVRGTFWFYRPDPR